MCEKRAKLAAASQKLPVPVVRTMNSQKSPWMVNISDLAVYIDSRYERYRKTWEKVQMRFQAIQITTGLLIPETIKTKLEYSLYIQPSFCRQALLSHA
ncbi:pyocin activator PrtN family protein [Endozoicomonas sp. ONNA2]|uniref:pyocin activator PrtN family protein n=1 Tax=Endozoicomonas sp. ONNA2 TaxID=2828741 RepID=UPI0021471DB4|nr:pyocin activator PrtN family protein [Endozoicomonas sp. ONNA2]